MLPSSKLLVPLHGSSTTAAATATARIDTQGYDFLSLDVVMATANTTSNKPSVLKLEEGDTTVLTNAVTFGATGGTDFTVPAADTANVNLYKFNVDLRGRKRYIFLSASPRTTQTISAVANLHRGDEMPDSAADAGVDLLHEM